MYKIIGADKKEYGPVSADQLHHWISEGRANGQSLVQVVGSGEWKPLSAIPEFAEGLRVHAEPSTPSPSFSTGAPLATVPMEDVLARDYELDIGGCISRGWSEFKANLGVLIGSFAVVMLLAFAVNGILDVTIPAVIPRQVLTGAVSSQLIDLVSLALSALIIGPLLGGFYAVVLQVIRRRPAAVGDVFAGFQKAFKQLFLGYLVMALISSLCLLPFNIAFFEKVLPILGKLEQATAAEFQNLMPQLVAAIVSVLPVFLLCMIPVIFLSVCWGFTLPLIMDKGLTFGSAMMASWKMVGKHWWQVFGLTILTGLINLLGLLCCGVGLLFTIPIGFAALMFAYEVIFSGRNPQGD